MGELQINTRLMGVNQELSIQIMHAGNQLTSFWITRTFSLRIHHQQTAKVYVANVSVGCFADSQMKNFAAHASDDEPQSPIIPAFAFKKNYPLCARYSSTPPKGADVKLNCKANVQGRYVYIHTSQKSPLTLCEVQIFGKPVADKIPGKALHDTN